MADTPADNRSVPDFETARINDRPLIHFTPPANWMNDPNGLVFFNGEYHLFYQYHPASTVWGPMHWGHAVSHDLLDWKHLPIALRPDEHGAIFSGSAVVDWRNTSGFGEQALVALFTYGSETGQHQGLAYSTDAGRTWAKHPANPVLLAPPDTPDFRDPKVFWYGDVTDGHWVMLLAAGHDILFYVSADLTRWRPTGRFGDGQGATGGVWETPDLFRLAIDNGPETRWVLLVSVQEDAPAGGSGTQYFIGHFDGHTFTSEHSHETVLWVDWGADFYAPQSWSDLPDDRRLAIAWMNNWAYARLVPATDVRGSCTLPRELSLTQTLEGARLVQRPAHELAALRGPGRAWHRQGLAVGEAWIVGLAGAAHEILAEFDLAADPTEVGLCLCTADGARLKISYRPMDACLSIDRVAAGRSDFHAAFAGVHRAPLALPDCRLRLHVFVDRTSVEVFAADGRVTLTDLIFPEDECAALEAYALGAEATLTVLEVFALRPGRGIQATG